MNNSVLNLDVLHVIMAYATRDTVSKLMRTCHILNREGGQYLLVDRVTLCTETDAVSFLSFLFERDNYSESSNRMRWVRSLALAFGSAPPTQSIIPGAIHSIFTSLSLYALNFADLSICNAEELFALDPSDNIPSAIASLRTLRTLSIDEGGRLALRMLGRLQSCLQRTQMLLQSAAAGMDLAGSIPDEKNARRLFEGSQAQCPESFSDHGPLSFAVTGSKCLAIRELHIGDIDPPVVRDQFDALLYFEPLDVLDLLPHTAPDMDGIDRQCLANVLRSPPTENSIHKVCGPIKDLGKLGLNCRTDFLDAWECLAGWDDDMEDMLGALLMDTRPVHLTLLINDMALFLSEDFRELCLLEPMQHLESFHLFIELHPYEYRMLNMAPILEAIYEGVRAMTRLCAFKLTVSWFPLCTFADSHPLDDDSADFDTARTSWDGYEAPESLRQFVVQDFFVSWDPNTVVDRLLGASGRLAAVHVTVNGPSPEYGAAVERGSYEKFGD